MGSGRHGELQGRKSPTSGEWRAVVGCDVDCEVRAICRLSMVCCGNKPELKDRMLLRARLHVEAFRSWVVAEANKLGLPDLLVYQRYLEWNRDREAREESEDDGESGTGTGC